MKRLALSLLALALAGPLFAGAGWAQEVKLGSLNDLTGPTSDVGKDVALGIREAVQFVNDTGGINGKRIRLYLYRRLQGEKGSSLRLRHQDVIEGAVEPGHSQVIRLDLLLIGVCGHTLDTYRLAKL